MNLSDKARAVIGAVAPVLGATLGGPLGNLAGVLIGRALGTGEDARAAESAILAAQPETLEKIRLAEIELQRHAADNALDLERINAGDRSSAREREKAVRDRMPGILAVAITCGFFGVLGYMLGHELPPAGHDALLVMLGSLGTAWAAVVGYYFGSSSGSATKTAALARLAERDP